MAPFLMTIDEKIQLGIVALTVVSSVALAAHFGHVNVPKPFLDAIGPGGGST